ncbi:GntR family transcriptional regulator [Actinomadura litoris]|uniref:GntR family transcriptional regulator n=1 Tax=Actinomadura litoris TaxID=2678616 RepID=UPI001FA81549|nr:GntR family transcriptional regulator [Actinomadura litoris]
MAPAIQRPDPPYMQVVTTIRAQIESGELREGDMLPSTRQISQDWEISHATATKVLAALRSEGLARGVQGVGTIVTTSGNKQAAKDRMLAVRRTGRVYPPDQHAVIKSADLVEAPKHVADALRLEPGARVIRRHRVTYRERQVLSSSVSWFDGALAETAPRLLETERIRQGTFGYIAEQADRAVKNGQEQKAADAATEQDAEDLGVELGAPVLRGRNWVYDAEGDVLEYGESVAQSGQWASYEYEITN